MNSRQRFVETLRFGNLPQRALYPGNPRESTLETWNTQGLPPDRDWRDSLTETIGIPRAAVVTFEKLPVSFNPLPEFEEKILEHRDGHYIVQDRTGAIVEISDQYDFSYLRSPKDFVTRRWHSFPVKDRRDWEEKMRWRYTLDHAERFARDFTAQCRALSERDVITRLEIPGPFWQLRDWVGFEDLCILFVEQPDLVQAMIDFWSEFVSMMLARLLSQIQPDYVQINEDMAYKAHSMISPQMTKRFLLPVWKRWNAQLDAARGIRGPVKALDSDGYVAELIPLWIQAGFNTTFPIEVAAGNDIVAFRRQYGAQIAYIGGLDKRALAEGGAALHAEVMRVVPPLFAHGGFLPACDHGVPPDISWQNFVEYSRLLAQLSGWF
jgi:uroporphyrinogen decarboxylase